QGAAAREPAQRGPGGAAGGRAMVPSLGSAPWPADCRGAGGLLRPGPPVAWRAAGGAVRRGDGGTRRRGLRPPREAPRAVFSAGGSARSAGVVAGPLGGARGRILE